MRKSERAIPIALAFAMVCGAAFSADHGLGLTVSESGVLLKDGEPYRGMGINYFSAFSRRLQNAEDTSYREGFKELSSRGIPFVRFMACGFWPSDWKLYFSDKDAYFELMDDVVNAAEEHGIGIIPSLFWYHGCLPDLVEESHDQWGNPESKTIALMRQYTREMVSRYVDSPAVWAWELGNEYNLAADLPNAAEHRPKIVPRLGTALSRSEKDDLTTEMLLVIFREFAKTVRSLDPTRPITPGNSIPRPAAHHMRTERTWERDTPEQFAANLALVNPDPNNLVSIHLYPHANERRFAKDELDYEEVLTLCLAACAKEGKALFVGEFGARDDEEHGGREQAKRESRALIAAIEKCGVPLSALWNYDLPQQESYINVTPTNHRAYLLDELGAANRRMRGEE